MLADDISTDAALEFALKDKQRTSVKTVLPGEDVHSQMALGRAFFNTCSPWSTDARLMSPLARIGIFELWRSC